MEHIPNQTKQLFAEIIDVWEHGLYGIDIGQLIIAISIIALALIARGAFSRFVIHWLHSLTKKTKTNIDDVVIETLAAPLRFIPVVIGLFFAFSYLDLSEGVSQVAGSFIRSLIAFTIFWSLYRALKPLSQLLGNLRTLLTSAVMDWLFKILRILVIFLGAAVILEIWGIQIGPLLAGLGLFGAAIALGAQDVFKNLIGGLTIIAEKKFHPGDWIRVEGVVEGTVDSIGLRSTQVRRFDKAPVQVPNAMLSDAAVTNFSRMTHRRIYWKIGVEYRTTSAQLKVIRDEIMAYIEKNESFASKDEVSTFVHIDEFGASSIDILVYCFTRTTVWGEWLAIKEEFAIKIKEIIEDKAKTSFAFPSQSIYIESLPHKDTPETFTPPKTNTKT